MTTSRYAIYTSTAITVLVRFKHIAVLVEVEVVNLVNMCRKFFAIGHLDRLERGLYRLSDLPFLSEPDLVTVAHKIPQGVICLISALSFHELTTQIPHAVYVALKRGTEPPRLHYPPTRVFWFSGKAYTSGVEQHQLDGSDVHIYSIEKTLADCFKYRNKIGMDTTLEALKRYFEKKNPQLKALNKYARICRVEKIMRPYIESQL